MKIEENTFGIVNVQTTYRCQMRCANCYLGNMLNNPKFGDMDMTRLENLLKRLPRRTEIRFSGAEPTMHRRFPDMIRLTRRYGHRPTLLTNGLKMRKETYARELKKAGLYIVGLSTNGGLDDEVYERFDNGKYAKQKMAALENCFKYKIVPHTNIILDPTNLHVIRPLYEHVIGLAQKYDVRLGMRFPSTFRVKSVGRIGAYLDTYTYKLPELIEIMEDALQAKINPVYAIQGYDEKNICVYAVDTPAGQLFGKITDWTVDDEGIPDAGSKRRGVLTYDDEIVEGFEYMGGIDEVHQPRLERSELKALARA